MYMSSMNSGSVKSVARTIKEMMDTADAASAKTNAHNALLHQMKKILADGYTLYFKAHTFHWNVEGSNFPQYHEFFNKVYEDVYDRLDPIAEQMRSLGAYAPISLKDLLAMSSIKEASSIPSPNEMFKQLHADNEYFIGCLTTGYKLAEAAQHIGLSNFLQDLVDKHTKLSWMIASTSKGA